MGLARSSFLCLGFVFVGLGDWQGVLFFVWVLFLWAWVIGKEFFSLFGFCFRGLKGVLFFVWVLFSWAWVIGKEFFSLFDLELFNLELSFDSLCVS